MNVYLTDKALDMAGHSVDKHVGSRIRELRALRGMSQTALREAVGVEQYTLQRYS